MLWGGLFMLVSIILLLSFISNQIKVLASVIGGIGFGTFIDELGKFLTSNNDYFFQPTIALIYLLFIGLYFLARAIDKKIILSKREYLINALEITKEAVIADLDEVEKKSAMALLKKADKKDPIVKSLISLLEKTKTIKSPKPNLYTRLKNKFKQIYNFLVEKKWFRTAVVVFFILYSFFSLFQTAALIPGLRICVLINSLIFLMVLFLIIYWKILSRLLRVLISVFLIGFFAVSVLSFFRLSFPVLNFWEIANLISSTIPAFIILFSLVYIKKSFNKFLTRIKTAVLFQIFITQFFSFYFNQLLAIISLLINIDVLFTLNYMLQYEK
jgi:hypothetical protein